MDAINKIKRLLFGGGFDVNNLLREREREREESVSNRHDGGNFSRVVFI